MTKTYLQAHSHLQEGKVYPQSKNWDMNVSFAELIKSNPMVRLDTNYRCHKSDDCFGVFQLSMNHPSKEYGDERTLLIGICEDGFVYDGTSSENTSLPLIPVEKGLRILMNWGNMMNARSELESDLTPLVETDCVNVVLSNSYTLEKTYKFNR